jgi:hypothetical protein
VADAKIPSDLHSYIGDAKYGKCGTYITLQMKRSNAHRSCLLGFPLVFRTTHVDFHACCRSLFLASRHPMHRFQSARISSETDTLSSWIGRRRFRVVIDGLIILR